MKDEVKNRIHGLWDELSEFAAAEADAAMLHALQTLADLVDAKQAYWLGALRLNGGAKNDPANGWRPRVLRYLHPWANQGNHFKTQYNLIETGQVDPAIAANLRDAGRFRINIQHEFVPPGWFESEYYKLYFASRKVRDCIYAVTPLGPDIESWFGFQRIGDTAPLFTDAEREILDYAVRPLRWFHHTLALHHGLLLANTSLTASERRVLSCLLTDMTEQEIGVDLGLTQTTVHTYCARICRKFGVRGRTGLTALWLGHQPAK